MARTIAQIQASIVAAKNADPTIGVGGTNPLNSTSNTAIWLLWSWVQATSQYVTESLFDAFVALVQSIIGNTLPHTLNWYGTMAKAFQYGYALPVDSDVYNPVAPAGDASLIITNAQAVEVLPYVRVKVATGTVGALAPLSGPQLTAFTAYMNYIKDAGVPVQCTSGLPDTLRTGIVIFYDPQVLSATGARLDGSNDTPVQQAINNFITSLPFNGVFETDNLIAALKLVDGVKAVQINYCAASYADVPFTPIIGLYVPDAGYLTLDAAYFEANTIYTPYNY